MEIYENRDGLSTSWGADRDARWNAFRDLLNAGVDPRVAARRAGIDR